MCTCMRMLTAMTQPTTEAAKPPMLTVDEAADQLGISREKLYGLMRDGEIAYVLFPPGNKQSARRIEQSELDAFKDRYRQRAIPA